MGRFPSPAAARGIGYGVDPMSSRPFGLSAQELLRQDRWLRELVRSLVGESDVDDVVQETWASALRRGTPVERPRAWLAVVAGNFARRRLRSLVRRSQREEAAARPEAVPSTAETLELLDLQQHVLRAVRELGEPYRTSVLLRYTHGLSVPEIAARTGVSEAGVRQRLKRGLDALRADVGVRCGEGWHERPALAAWLVHGAVAMKKMASVVAALVAVASVGALAVWLERPAEPAGQGAAEPLRLVGARSGERQRPASDLARPEAPARARVAADDASPPEPAATFDYAGRVLDARGRPLAGVGLAPTSRYVRSIPSAGLERPPVATSTAADGTFQLSTDLERGEVVTGPGWVPVAVRPFHGGSGETLLVAAPAVELAGAVVDPDGAPLEAVTVRVVGIGLRDFVGVLDGLQSVEWLESSTDAAGRFRHRDLPAGTGRLRFEKEGYRARELEIGALDEREVQVTLEADEIAYVVTGWVLAPNGAPVEAALVGLGDRTTRSAADGAFELRIPSEQAPAHYDALWAASPPWRTEVVERVGAALLDEPSKELEYELVFDGEALTIGGRVVDQEGAPVAGAIVYLWRQRELMTGRSAEELAVPEDREQLQVGQGLRVWSRTDAEGRFHLDGLCDAEYTLRVLDRERFAAWTSGPVRAGEQDVVLTLPADFVRAKVEGRVVDRSGAGVAGVMIRPQVGMYLSTSSLMSVGDARQFETDEEGRFTLTDVSGGDLILSLHSPSIMPENQFLEDGGSLTDVEVVVDPLCHFRLVLSGERARATSLQILDAAGEALNVAAIGGGEYSWSTWRSFEGGRTRVLSVGQAAATLVLYDDAHEEVDRLPLALGREDVNEIDW